ncbi:uncharacterized protein LOC122510730 isoform X2 [Leptopilina heterotoma]|uniref:uncharacterized protein LOC122510730 isoform X2 n=1 Tax=Leptopilina heterotoma TaxID=63436 RepID=UPI001CA84956|nr:uncharacterized protein LOC122510730 isoform X2 [Leptopilina heterotoma]
MYSSIVKETETGIPQLSNIQKTLNKNLPERLQSSQDEKYPEISMKTFLDFMRTAYQVNNCFDLNSLLSEKSEIDWNALVKTDLDVITEETSPEEQITKNDSPECENSQISKEEIESKTSPKCENQNEASCDIQTNSIANKTTSEAKELQQEIEEKKLRNDGMKLRKKSCETVEFKETFLSKSMKKKLSEVLHEGFLDSVLPYMVPKSASQPAIKKSSATNHNTKKTLSANNLESKASTSIFKDKDKSLLDKKISDTEIEIHVCDEAKNVKRDFRCPQKLLIQKMCYFADVTAGQKLEEMDISVHCDIVIFDWLMRWVKKDLIKKSEWPILEPNNVIPIMVSASFLQMDPLTETCLNYSFHNMSEVLKTSTVMTCLNDNLLTRLANLFSNSDLEMIKDKKDKIQSRLFCKLIISLGEVTPDNKRGHFSSLATLFKCGKCGKNIVRSISDFVPCIPSAMLLDSRGNLHSKHTRDPSWNLNDYITLLRNELKSWRKVYWRLWGDCHFISCQQCENYFPINQMDWCSYHPEVPQFFVLEQQRASPFPLGRYPCCSQRAYRFEALPNKEGCKFREHIPHLKSEQDEGTLNVFANHRDIIVIEPPQLFFPEKITRLAARDSSIPAGKLSCKEIMWWEGIELVPPRQKLGLLGKIWSGSGFRKPCAPLEKTMSSKARQLSQTTDASSPISSETESDDDNLTSGCKYSSFDDDTLSSEESNVLPSLKSSRHKIKPRPGKRQSEGFRRESRSTNDNNANKENIISKWFNGKNVSAWKIAWILLEYLRAHRRDLREIGSRLPRANTSVKIEKFIASQGHKKQIRENKLVTNFLC